MLEIMLGLLTGIILGSITGLIPGLHTNTISSLIVASILILLNHLTPVFIITLLISMSVTNSFTSIIPSVFLGAPDDANALGVLPGHKLLMMGRGVEAVKLNVLGSFFALITSSILFLPLILIVPFFYSVVKPNLFYLLIIVALLMLFKERNKVIAVYVFLISGFLGYFAFNSSVNAPLMPLLSGFFGISTLLLSLKDDNKIPKQDFNANPSIKFNNFIKSNLLGTISGFIISVLPGVGNSTAAAAVLRFSEKSKESFLMIVGNINTTNFILSIITFYVLNKARNGSIVALKSLIIEASFNQIIMFLGIVLISGSFSVLITIKLAKIFASFCQKINYKLLILAVISFLIILVSLVSGFKGVLLLVLATLIGLIPASGKTSRSLCTGCILLPVIVYFIPF